MKYDYDKKAWVDDNDKYMDCNHPEGSVFCTCYGRLHKGERIVIRPPFLNRLMHVKEWGLNNGTVNSR